MLFDPESRGGMARRGAPDKSGPPATDWIVLHCPTCGSDLRLEAGWTEGEADVLCACCETEIPLPLQSVRLRLVR
ncbi:MAG TPA: hypothetical protein VGH97_01995 [Thermoanaerobaculia bacterium]